MQTSTIEHPVFVENDEQLAQLCERWSDASVLALDTEFIRTDTFYAIAALLQISDGDNCYLIDPLKISQFEPLALLMRNPNIIKVLHACGEDLEVIDSLLGALPQPLFDTQLAAAMLNYGFSLSYQRLVEQLVDVHVSKHETRSDWLQRPLSTSQAYYAALDVAYLLPMYQLLAEQLLDKGRMSWLEEECRHLIEQYTQSDALDVYYKKVKSAWKLSRAQLAVLKELTLWRETSARERNIPRSRVLSDKSCYEIARSSPKLLRSLASIDGVTAKVVRKDGETILAIVNRALQLTGQRLPELLPRPLPAQCKSVLKLLKSEVAERAGQLGIARELLVKKRDFEALLRSGIESGEYRLPASLSGWRKPIIGEQLLAIVQS